MLTYESRVREQFDRLKACAERVRVGYVTGRPLPDLLADAEAGQAPYHALKRWRPAGTRVGERGRSIWFVRTRIEQDEPHLCREDVIAVCEDHIAAQEDEFRQWCQGTGRFDEELARSV